MDKEAEAWARRAAPIAAVTLFLLAWEIVVHWKDIPPYLLPAPSLVLLTLWQNLGSLMQSWWVTVSITFAALALAVIFGVLLGSLFTLSRWAEWSFTPFAVVLQVTPIIAIAPLVMILTDSAIVTVLICAWIVAFFPVLAGTVTGLRSADANLRDLFRLYRATPWQRLRLLLAPSALPSFLTCLKVAGGLRRGGRVHSRCRRAQHRAGVAHSGSGLPHRDPENVRCAAARLAHRRGDLHDAVGIGEAASGAMARQRALEGPTLLRVRPKRTPLLTARASPPARAILVFALAYRTSHPRALRVGLVCDDG
jgi:NitT/TauT family transport system permease protein